MKIKLTLRYILMIVLSVIILMASAFMVLTYIENTFQNNDTETPDTFAYNFVDEIKMTDSGEVIISDDGKAALLEENGWIQILNQEGYVTQGFNEPDNPAEHYSPTEITFMHLYSGYEKNYLFNVGKTTDNIEYIVAIPKGSWNRYIFEMDQEMIKKFLFTMFFLAVIVFSLMGFIFSQRIASPVAKVISGVERLSAGDYKTEYKENGLYKRVFASLNHLAGRLKTSEIEREKTKKQREKWISNISHDMKTPLSTIKGYSEVLSDTEYDLSRDEIKKYSEIILAKSVYMEDMIEELRLNEKLMHNGIHLDKKAVNLTVFIKEIVIDISNHPGYSDRKVDFYSDEENLTFSCDKDLMKRAVENLIYNALIHNDSDTKVKISMSEVDRDILIDIKDDGRGMSDEELDKLFNRYYRGTNTKDYKGSGLGMSIAKEVIEAHGGEIEVVSELGKGTHIKIKL
ncbi:sensor histidine kinase [Alkalibacterium kapii]|uniref:histidine kinase n=1 Tax=Alkalibacterium kapii TaxID=426704 RepID=A0A511ARB1_9LACT|nr:HAMP domain-containing sensor histidine kinase [Alkalibacterium kapii]GEK90739.1 two-component sensor histidine kinase [Alkalibacterium kapii]